MKVLMIGSERRIFEPGSAAERRILSYGSLVAELHVIAFTRAGFRHVRHGNVFLHPTNSSNRFLYFFDALRIALSLRGRGIDLVSAQDPFESGVCAYFASWLLGARLHVQVHTDFLSPLFSEESAINRMRVRFARFVLPRAHGIRAVSKRIVDSIIAAGLRVQSSPTVLPIFVPREFFDADGDQNFLRNKYPKFDAFIFMADRLEREKNFPLALAAFADVAKDFPHVALVVAGSGTELLKLKMLVKKNNLEDRVFFEGWQNNIKPYLYGATLFLSTSNYEGYGLTFIEAAGARLPIVTTDVGIVKEIFNLDAFIAPVGDKALLADVIKSVLQDTTLAREKATRAYERASAVCIQEEEYLKRYKMDWEACL